MAVREIAGSAKVRTYRIAAFSGAMGVLSGYAAFLYYRELYNDPESCPLRIAVALLVAAAISYAIEWLREVIREGKVESSRHPLIRTMGTFVVVLLFELFIAGFHAASEGLNGEVVRDLAAKIVGASTNESGGWLSLGLAAGTWVVVGSALATRLSRNVRTPQNPLRAEVWRSSRSGLRAGMLVAPLALLGYVLVSRSILAFQNLAYRYDSWTAVVDAVGRIGIVKWLLAFALPRILTAMAVTPMVLLSMASHHGVWLFLGTFVILLVAPIGIINALPKERKSFWWNLPEFFSYGCIVGTIVPLAIAIWLAIWPLVKPLLPLSSLSPLRFGVPAAMPQGSLHGFQIHPYRAEGWPTWAMAEAMLLALVIWAIPGLLFGVLVPMLRWPARHGRNWAFIGYAAAGLMVLASLVTWHAWPLIPAAIAALAGVLFDRGISVEEYWPFAALCVALGVCGATSIEQRLTFAGVVTRLHTLDAVPAAPVPAAYAVTSEAEQRAEQKAKEEKLDGEEERKGRDLAKNNNDPEIQGALNGPCDKEALRLVAAQWDLSRFWSNQPKYAAELGVPFNGRVGERLGQHTESRRQDLRKCVLANAPHPEAQAAAEEHAPAATGGQGAGGERERACLPKRPPMDAKQAAQALEIAITGSVGFWITVGLLACWSVHEHGDGEEEQHHGSHGDAVGEAEG